MRKFRSLKLEWLHGRLGDVAYQLTQMDFTRLAGSGWVPAINAFRCEKALTICVDLAGVDTAQIELLVESGRLLIRGTRPLPEPPSGCCQVIAMEIDYGPFQREVLLPTSVDLAQVTAEQREGLLWIELPIL